MDYRYEALDELSSTDLTKAARDEVRAGRPVERARAWTFDPWGYIDSNSGVDVLFMPQAYPWGGLIGIVDGADAHFADADSLEEGLEMYFNDRDEFAASR
jgi:hypothetical protein